MAANPLPSRQDPDPFADRRAYPRVSVALPAFLQVGTARFSVQILDLSAGGAKLRCPSPLRDGATVMLDCGTFERPAVVRWQNDGLSGVSFESELDAREMSALVDRSQALSDWMERD